jgi:hypothetical protein
MKEIYNKVLEAVAIDPRLDTGIFDVLNNDHLSVFREYLVKEGISEDTAIAASNKLAEAGRFPERQAYNKDGLLVTFPSPEHKQRAIARGTHFERNPKSAQVNIFGAETQPQQPAQPAPAQQTVAPTTIAKPAAPTQAPVKQSVATTQSADVTPVNADNRTPEERAADANAVEKMLKTEGKSYTLSEAIAFGFYSKNNIWYTSDGEKVGRLWYVADRKQQIILPC